jgi:hypothetical protein
MAPPEREPSCPGVIVKLRPALLAVSHGLRCRAGNIYPFSRDKSGKDIAFWFIFWFYRQR